MPSLFQIKSYLRYWLDAVDEHSLHSPFFYDFQNKVVKRSSNPEDFKSIENLRQKLKNSNQKIEVKDLGAGSTTLKDTSRNVSDIARTSLTPPKYSALYANIIKHFECKNVIELGTSFGINTLYLSSHDTSVTTFEGAPSIAEIAKTTFEFAKAKNIKVIEGDINNTLPTFLIESKKIDFAFIDANHRFESTVKYFEWIVQKTHSKSVIIIDDINLSPAMEKAWKMIRENKLVYGSADLYRCGIVFFDPSLNKQHVILQF
jgi:predicted O-methyltransferase YrrM